MKQRLHTVMDLNDNETALAIDFENPAIANRLNSMGILPGTRIERVRTAPFGKAIYVKCDGVRMALRFSEAKSILIEL